MKKCKATITWICIILVNYHLGCTTAVKPPPDIYRSEIKHIGVATGEFYPEVSFKGADKKYLEGSLSTAGQVFAPFLGVGAVVSKAGVAFSEVPLIGVPIMLMGLGIIALGVPFAAIGGAVGAVNADHKPGVHESHKQAEAALAAAKGQVALRDSVFAEAQRRIHCSFVTVDGVGPKKPGQKVDYSSLAAQNIDTVLEVSFLEIVNSIEKYSEPALTMFITAQARLIRVADGEKLFDEEFVFQSKRRYLSEWLSHDQISLRRGFDYMIARLSRKIVEEAFFIDSDLPAPFPKPTYPAAESAGWAKIESLQPTFKWNEFPGITGSDDNWNDKLQKIQNVTYDVRVSRMTGGLENFEVVLDRTHISEPHYTLKTPLDPGTKHFWCVRARFEVDGRSYLTPWSAIDRGGRRLASAPNVHSYRFKTPGSAPAEEPTPMPKITAATESADANQAESILPPVEARQSVHESHSEEIPAVYETDVNIAAIHPVDAGKQQILQSVVLRDQPKKRLTASDLDGAISKHGFYNSATNQSATFENDLVDNGDGTITDRVTGLMWQQGGSVKTHNKIGADRYVEDLNNRRYAGYADWRLPTVEELASLLSHQSSRGLHIDTMFDYRQIRCWSIDSAGGSYANSLASAWIVDYKSGNVSLARWVVRSSTSSQEWYVVNPFNHIRAVRSASHLPAPETVASVDQTPIENVPAVDSTAAEITAVDPPPTIASVPPAKKLLRSQPRNNLASSDLNEFFMIHGFYHSIINTYSSFENELVDNGDGTVTDRATRLMWEKNGSPSSIDIQNANKYIEQLKEDSFAGYSDWRMPTIEELASLLEGERTNNLHIDSVFSPKQTRCWSADRAASMHGHRDTTTAWVMDYRYGRARRTYFWNENEPAWASQHVLLPDNYVRAVRSLE